MFNHDSDDRDFYVVVDGSIQLFVEHDSEDDDNLIMLNDVKSGGTVASLFGILSILSDDDDLDVSDSVDPDVLFPNIKTSPLHSTSSTNVPLDATILETIPTELKDSSNINDQSIETKASTTRLKENDIKFPYSDLKPPPINFKEKQKRPSFHPNVTAKASQPTTLIVIPAAAFKTLSEKFPTATAGIIQVILTRFQRVTCSTMYRYLSLSHELLKIEKMLNTGEPIPIDFYDFEWDLGLAALKRRRGLSSFDFPIKSHKFDKSGVDSKDLLRVPRHEKLSTNISFTDSESPLSPRLSRNEKLSKDISLTDSESPLSPRLSRHEKLSINISQMNSESPLSPKLSRNEKLSTNISQMNSDGPLSPRLARLDKMDKNLIDSRLAYDGDEDSDSPQIPTLPTKSFIFTDDDPDLRLKQAAFELIVKFLNFNPESIKHSPSRRESLSSIASSNTPKTSLTYIHDLLNKVPITPPRKSRHRRYSIDSTTEDEISSIPPFKDIQLVSDIEIKYFPQGSVLVKEASRIDGFHLVLSGVLEALVENASGFKSNRAYEIKEGGVAGYLNVLTGFLF